MSEVTITIGTIMMNDFRCEHDPRIACILALSILVAFPKP